MAKRRSINSPSLINVWAAAFGGAFIAAAEGNTQPKQVPGAYTRYLKKIGQIAMPEDDKVALTEAEARRQLKNEKRLYNRRRCLENTPGYLTETLDDLLA